MKKILKILIKILVIIFLIGIILIILLLAGFELNQYYQKHSADKIIEAVNTNDIEKLNNLKLKKGINGYYNYSTPLIYAIYANNVEAVKYFIEQGADLYLERHCPPATSCVDINCSPLNLAIIHRHKEIVEVLIANGADVNHSSNGVCGLPIFNALYSRDIEIIRAIINADANLNVVDYSGKTPLSYAKERPSKEVLSLMRIVEKNKPILKEKDYKEIEELLIANGAKE